MKNITDEKIDRIVELGAPPMPAHNGTFTFTLTPADGSPAISDTIEVTGGDREAWMKIGAIILCLLDDQHPQAAEWNARFNKLMEE